MIRILFVCLGNICRSPTAEGVMCRLVSQAGLQDRVFIDSAGTGDWHVGKSPDSRTRRAASLRGYDLSALRGRQIEAEDFYRFDLILAMDHGNLDELQSIMPADASAELDLFLRRCHLQPEAVPDPYYGGEQGFEKVLDLLEQGCERLLDEIQERM